ncbi:MAG: glycosyltransferase [Candidatus Eisenbacteria bacterium]|uniref:Glycosyltransferase n=1 Tax=Eiseniibacteriota bacterium TaxID=2212470 RepID=A0A948RWK3_UNCEI|nr:glycosyltransferase [Candidatus Eisenbacteria bacterium]MBU1948400.1 glycosyltransferase [Candidatus Eisenbacteria bacterium]MBU2691291.1 glycosyltransferase [Candidatus Eisenbacteria bacterium]
MKTNPKTEAEQIAFYDETYDRFLKARAAVGEVICDYRIAGVTIRLSFAGERLLTHLTPALEHLKIIPDGLPDLTFCLWDSQSTGIRMPDPPCHRDHFTDRGDIWGFNSERIRTAFHWHDYSVNLLDHQCNNGIYWVATAETLPYWVKASPLRTLIHWGMERRGRQLLHAAAVGTEKGAVLITGKGGVGKSSTALACLQAGYSYVADDYLIVGLDPEPVVYNLYGTAKLDADNIDQYPMLRPHIKNPDKLRDEKAVLFLHPYFEDQMQLEMPLRALLVPGIVDAERTSFKNTEPSIARQAASFTTMSQLPNVGRRTYEFFDRLCSRLPCYRIELGRDRALIPRAIADFLDRDPGMVSQGPLVEKVSSAGRQNPLISVVIPVYNGAAFIKEAVENVLAQAYPSLEIIIVDDGSTDGTAEIIRGLPCDIRYFRQDNNGAASARNRGIRDTAGDLITFLDVDDLWPENNLRMLVDEMSRRPELDLIHGYAQLVEYSPRSKTYEYRGNPRESFPYYIGAGLYRKRVFDKVGLFDKTLKFGEDTDWYNRANEQKIPMMRIEAVTLLVRRHGGNMTHGKSLVELNMLRVFKKALDRKRILGEDTGARED